jgi:hypothetical protein
LVDIYKFIRDIGGIGVKYCYDSLVDFSFGNKDVLSDDGRGGKRKDYFYDVYPDIETSAKYYVRMECSKKKCSFTAKDLAVLSLVNIQSSLTSKDTKEMMWLSLEKLS